MDGTAFRKTLRGIDDELSGDCEMILMVSWRGDGEGQNIVTCDCERWTCEVLGVW